MVKDNDNKKVKWDDMWTHYAMTGNRDGLLKELYQETKRLRRRVGFLAFMLLILALGVLIK